MSQEVWLEIDVKTLEEDGLTFDHGQEFLVPEKVYIKPEDAAGWCIESVLRADSSSMVRLWPKEPYYAPATSLKGLREVTA